MIFKALKIFNKNTNAKKLTATNIVDYIEKNYGSPATKVSDKHLIRFVPLLQNDFGGDNDCALTSMTAIIHNLTGLKHQTSSIYSDVEKNARKYLFTNAFGLYAPAINSVLNKTLSKYCSKQSKTANKKNVGYNFNTIVSQINKNNPMILNIVNDGRGFYKKHSVVVVGYAEYSAKGKKRQFLKVYDNWSREIGYVDYAKLSSSSSLNYIN